MNNKTKYLKLLAYRQYNGEFVDYQDLWCYIEINKELLEELIKLKNFIPKFKRDKDLLSVEYRTSSYPLFIKMEEEERINFLYNFDKDISIYIEDLPINTDLFEKIEEKLDYYKFVFQDGWFFIQGTGKWSGDIYETERYSIKDLIKKLKRLVK